MTTVGEETGFSGRGLGRRRYQPNMAVAVDVTFARRWDRAGMRGYAGRVALGGGPGLCVGIMGHPVMNPDSGTGSPGGWISARSRS